MKKIFTLSCLVLLSASLIMLGCAKERTGATYTCKCTINVYVNNVNTETTTTSYTIAGTDPYNAQAQCDAYDANLTQTNPKNGQIKSCVIQ